MAIGLRIGEVRLKALLPRTRSKEDGLLERSAVSDLPAHSASALAAMKSRALLCEGRFPVRRSRQESLLEISPLPSRFDGGNAGHPQRRGEPEPFRVARTDYLSGLSPTDSI